MSSPLAGSRMNKRERPPREKKEQEGKRRGEERSGSRRLVRWELDLVMAGEMNVVAGRQEVASPHPHPLGVHSGRQPGLLAGYTLK